MCRRSGVAPGPQTRFFSAAIGQFEIGGLRDLRGSFALVQQFLQLPLSSWEAAKGMLMKSLINALAVIVFFGMVLGIFGPTALAGNSKNKISLDDNYRKVLEKEHGYKCQGPCINSAELLEAMQNLERISEGSGNGMSGALYGKKAFFARFLEIYTNLNNVSSPKKPYAEWLFDPLMWRYFDCLQADMLESKTAVNEMLKPANRAAIERFGKIFGIGFMFSAEKKAEAKKTMLNIISGKAAEAIQAEASANNVPLDSLAPPLPYDLRKSIYIGGDVDGDGYYAFVKRDTRNNRYQYPDSQGYYEITREMAREVVERHQLDPNDGDPNIVPVKYSQYLFLQEKNVYTQVVEGAIKTKLGEQELAKAVANDVSWRQHVWERIQPENWIEGVTKDDADQLKDLFLKEAREIGVTVDEEPLELAMRANKKSKDPLDGTPAPASADYQALRGRVGDLETVISGIKSTEEIIRQANTAQMAAEGAQRQTNEAENRIRQVEVRLLETERRINNKLLSLKKTGESIDAKLTAVRAAEKRIDEQVKAAQTAETNAKSELDETNKAMAAANVAREQALAAQKAAETARDEAVSTRNWTIGLAILIGLIVFLVVGSMLRDNTKTTQNERELAEAARDKAEQTKKEAKTAQEEAKRAKSSAVTAMQEARGAALEATENRKAAEKDRQETLSLKNQAESFRNEVLAAQKAAEVARDEALQAKANAQAALSEMLKVAGKLAADRTAKAVRHNGKKSAGKNQQASTAESVEKIRIPNPDEEGGAGVISPPPT